MERVFRDRYNTVWKVKDDYFNANRTTAVLPTPSDVQIPQSAAPNTDDNLGGDVGG